MGRANRSGAAEQLAVMTVTAALLNPEPMKSMQQVRDTAVPSVISKEETAQTIIMMVMLMLILTVR